MQTAFAQYWVGFFGESLLQPIRGEILFIVQIYGNALSFHTRHYVSSVIKDKRHRVAIYSVYRWIKLYAKNASLKKVNLYQT